MFKIHTIIWAVFAIIPLAVSGSSQLSNSETEPSDTTLLNRYIAAAGKQMRTAPDSAWQYYNQALAVANNIIEDNDFPDDILEKVRTKKARAVEGIGNYFANTYQPDSAIEYYIKALTIYENLAAGKKQDPEKNQYLKMMGNLMLSIGATYFDKADDIHSSEYYRKSLGIAEAINDSMIQSKALLNLGMLHNNQGRFDEAIRNYYTAIKIFEDFGDKKGIAISYLSIGIIQRKQNQLEQAIDSYKKALEIFRELEDERGIRSCYNNLGICYYNNEEYEEALHYFNQALELNRQSGNRSAMASVYSNLSLVYREMEAYDKALENIRKSMELSKHIGPARNLMSSYINLASIYLSQLEKNTELAGTRPHLLDTVIINGEKGLAISDTLSFILERVAALEILKKAYEMKGDYRSAYEMADELITLNDSVYSSEKTEIIADIEKKYEAEKREQHIEQQDRLLRDQELQLQTEKSLRNILVIGTVLLMLGVLLVYYYYQQKNKANRALDDKNKLIEKQNREISRQKEELLQTNQRLTELIRFKERMTGMIVHDLKNPLNNILYSSDIDDDEFREQLIKQSGYDMLNLIQNILDVYKLEEAKMTIVKEQVNVMQILKECVMELALYISEKELIISYPENEFPAVHADRKLIKRTFSNLLSNAVKYAPAASKITLRFKVFNNTNIRFGIQNRGPAIPKDQQAAIFKSYSQLESRDIGTNASTGLGLSFCKMAVEAQGGEIGVESGDTGTEFWFTVPGFLL